MINVSKWSTRTKLVAPINEKADRLFVGANEARRFLLPSSDYCYLTIRSAGKFEHVKLMAVDNDTLHIVRGQDGTEPQSWGAGSCVEVEWNPAQLCEFTKQCVNGTSATSVAAGTYCLDCNTCIEIGHDGRITAVNGEKKCR